MTTKYVSLRVVSDLQANIVEFVDVWVHEKKTPVPRNEIFKAMRSNNCADITVKKAIEGLLRQGYLRRAIIGIDQRTSNRTFYVQLRRL